MLNVKELKKIKKYIEDNELIREDTYGTGRNIKTLIEHGEMPTIYNDVCEAIKESKYKLYHIDFINETLGTLIVFAKNDERALKILDEEYSFTPTDVEIEEVKFNKDNPIVYEDGGFYD